MMNSLPVELMMKPYRLRAIRDFDLEALHELFPESGAFGPSLADRRNWLKSAETIGWGRNPLVRLVMEDVATGRAIAGFTIDRASEAVATLRYGFRPSTAMTQLAGFALARTFAFESLNLIALRTDLVAGQDPLAIVHEELGYREALRLREWFRDHEDVAHDLITYEAVNPAWEGTA